MPHAQLGRQSPDTVQILTLVTSQPDRLGQTTTTWLANAAIPASVQPLVSEQQQQMGLIADRERWRVRLPRGQTLSLGGRLRMRGRDWKVVRTEPWESYHLVVVEGV